MSTGGLGDLEHWISDGRDRVRCLEKMVAVLSHGLFECNLWVSSTRTGVRCQTQHIWPRPIVANCLQRLMTLMDELRRF